MELLIVGQFGTASDVSAVSTGSQIMLAVTSLITGLTMGITILLGQKLGEGKRKEAGSPAFIPQAVQCHRRLGRR